MSATRTDGTGEPRDTPGRGRIAAVDAESMAAEAGLQPGDRVISVNGAPPRDAIDFRFRTTEEFVELAVIHDGEPGVVEFEKPPDETLGIDFTNDAFGGTTLCNNKCFFCFLKGLPKGLRKPLYVKDDDYRLSFLHGNFVTLTNLNDDDWVRLAEQRLSPLNVSVHATNLELRRELLGNPRAPDVRAQLRRLASIGIDVQTQVVLCPGVNDGAALDETIGELLSHENVRTIGVVPVGNSVDGEARIAHPGMRTHTVAEARRVVARVRRWQRRAVESRDGWTVFAADEFYLAAGARIPSAGLYDGFPQWENGIGMTRSLLDDWARTRRRIRRGIETGRVGPVRRRRATLACGTLIAPTLRRLAAEASALLGLELNVVAAPNTLFGARVNISGLIPGEDFARALGLAGENPGGDDARGKALDHPRGDALGDVVFLPRASLDYYGRHFLDDMTADDLEERVGRPLAFVYTIGEVVDWLMAAEAPESRAESPVRSNGRTWAPEPTLDRVPAHAGPRG